MTFQINSNALGQLSGEIGVNVTVHVVEGGLWELEAAYVAKNVETKMIFSGAILNHVHPGEVGKSGENVVYLALLVGSKEVKR